MQTNLEAERRRRLLTEASEFASEAIREFDPMNHPLGPVAHDLAARLDDEISETNRPRRIFLSNAGANKPLVRQFYEALAVAGFEPWIDAADMVAGDRLHRPVQAGLSKSCAAVFFFQLENTRVGQACVCQFRSSRPRHIYNKQY